MTRTPRVKPRHAKRRPGRVVVPGLIAMLLLGGALGAVRLWPATGSVMPQVEGAADVPAPASVDTAGSSRVTNTTDAMSRFASCQARVRAGDRAIIAARSGAGHWSEHVKAQYDADSGRITIDELNATFARTRVLAPDDVEGYNDAVAAYNRIPGPCTGVKATAKLAKRFAACATRADAQTPVLAAADRVMADWSTHAASMSRSRHQHNANAAQVWIEQYRAAPGNIDAWNQASAGYDPPPC